MRPKWLKLACRYSGLENTFSYFVYALLPRDNLYNNMFDFSTAGNYLRINNLAWKISTLYTFSSLVHSLLSRDNLFKNIFDCTKASDRDCVAAVERLPVSLCRFYFLVLWNHEFHCGTVKHSED